MDVFSEVYSYTTPLRLQLNCRVITCPSACQWRCDALNLVGGCWRHPLLGCQDTPAKAKHSLVNRVALSLGLARTKRSATLNCSPVVCWVLSYIPDNRSSKSPSRRRPGDVAGFFAPHMSVGRRRFCIRKSSVNSSPRVRWSADTACSRRDPLSSCRSIVWGIGAGYWVRATTAGTELNNSDAGTRPLGVTGLGGPDGRGS